MPAPDLTVNYQQLAAGERSEAQEQMPSEAVGHQVAVGNIPLEPPGFQYRAGLLAKLDQTEARVLVIHPTTGLPGLGTTQIAAAYARARLAADWRLVAWVSGADTGNLQAGLAAVAEAAGLTDGGLGGDTDASLAVRQLLETDGDRCLLVFDDVADPEALRPFLPAHGMAQVLITSTRQPSPGLATAVPVDMFTAEEARSFLSGRTGLDNEAGAAEVAAVLGHLPLALALAAPVIRGQRHGYARYLDRLQTIPIGVHLTGDDGLRYPHDFVRAVLLSLAAIRATDQTGMCTRVLQIMAVLSSAGVRRELLHVAGRAGVLGGGRRVEAVLVDQLLEWLSDRSLLTFSLDGKNVVMHRLLAQVVRDGLVRRRRLGAVGWVAASVLEAHAIAVAGSQDRPALRRIPQQVTALLDNMAELTEESDEELGEILLRLRFISLYHLIELGDSAPQAIAVGEPLTADLERLLGARHPDTLNARNSLAAAYLAAGRVADAIPLFERTLAVLQRQLGPDNPDTLTSRNNLASAYQDAGRVAEAIQLYELNLAERERLLGDDDPGTLNSRSNLAAAYLAAGRAAEAIPMLEQTLAGRERALGPDHSDTQTSRRNLAKAYQDVGRAAEAIPLLEQTSAGRQRVLRPDGRIAKAIPSVERTSPAREKRAPAAAPTKVLPTGFRRPPADTPTPVLPASFRRPPADAARQLLSDRAPGPFAKPPDHSVDRRTQDAPYKDAGRDRWVVEAITAGDPAGIAMAYDRYAAALYGYCHSMLHDSADAAESLQDTFIVAAARLGELPEPSKLRPWLFALARNECRLRIRPGSATRAEADATHQRADGGQRAESGQRADEVGHPTDAADPLADATMSFRVVGELADATPELADATTQFRSVGGPADATVQFPVVGGSADGIGELVDRTTQFRSIGELADATMPFHVVGQLADATMQFHIISQSADGTEGFADVNDYLGQAELQALIRSILADMKPREREVIELSFRNDLDDDDLAIALAVSESRAHALSSRTRGRLEKSFGTLRAALAGRQACPVVGELLADWDGQLTEQTRDLVAWHTEQCQTCINNARGSLRPTVLSGLLPLSPLPLELREKVLSRCSSSSEDAEAYRRRVVRRAQSTWAPIFSQAIRLLSWDSVRANLGAAIATTAVAVWVVAAVSVTLLIFAGSHPAHAQTAQLPDSGAAHAQAVQTNAGVPSRSPADAKATATDPTSAVARPSPTVTQPATYASSQVQPSSSPEASNSPSRSPSTKPSKSPSPKPSQSSSPSPSHTASPSSSSSSSPSPAA
jgi:RNA polymerase sigma factor (sigma-70 family)